MCVGGGCDGVGEGLLTGTFASLSSLWLLGIYFKSRVCVFGLCVFYSFVFYEDYFNGDVLK